MNKIKVLYVRVSTLEQKTDRQRVNEKDFDLVIEDKCSGAISFFEREGGKEIKKLIDEGLIQTLSVWQIDRLGRDLRDIMNTIHYFNEMGITIHFVSQGLSTLDNEGKENPISKMIISILGIVGEMERNQIKERQMEGIRIAKLKGSYTGRKKGSREDVLSFLSKDKNKKAVEYLKKGFKGVEVAKLTDLNINTITKIKKMMVS
ncbi:recombinase family protein [Bizionia sediminis]|uniref:Recombinase family protein n=1 Tax=Bizionia sediminis TaxID=1737064 RepID=A0ABW5KQ52_9FLAO